MHAYAINSKSRQQENHQASINTLHQATITGTLIVNVKDMVNQ